MKNIRIGVVGLGWVAGAHIETLRKIPGAEVVAVCSRRETSPEAIARGFGVEARVYSNYAAMLRDPDIDLIDICTEPNLHARQAVLAAEAGKHVLLEKPLALSWADAAAVARAVKKNKVRGAVCFEVRFSQQFQMYRSIIDRGLIGGVHYAEVDYYHGIGPWYGQYRWNKTKKDGGSSLLSAGCHALDAALMLLDGRVVEVSSMSVTSANKDFTAYEYPTTSVTILKLDSGAIAKVASCIDCLQPYYFHVHLVGSHGSVLDNKLYTDTLKGLKKQWATLPTSLVDSGDVHDHPYEPQFKELIDSLREDRPMALTSLESALETHRVIFAADRSARTGKPVRITRDRI